jgi:hypothetical protein
MLCPSSNTLSILSPLVVHTVAVVFQQCLAEAVDRPERGAQVVRDGLGEGFQFLVGGFQLAGALGDALLQFCVQLEDLIFGPLALANVALNRHPYIAIVGALQR